MLRIGDGEARAAALGLVRPVHDRRPGRFQQPVHERGVLGVVEVRDLRGTREQAAVVAGDLQAGQRPTDGGR